MLKKHVSYNCYVADPLLALQQHCKCSAVGQVAPQWVIRCISKRMRSYKMMQSPSVVACVCVRECYYPHFLHSSSSWSRQTQGRGRKRRECLRP